MKIKCNLTPEEVMEIVRKELILKGLAFTNMFHVVKIDTEFDEGQYAGITFELTLK
jgi:hypothetical protein